MYHQTPVRDTKKRPPGAGLIVALWIGLSGGWSDAAASEDVLPWKHPLPARQVERPLVLPRGWVEVVAGTHHRRARQVWTTGPETLDETWRSSSSWLGVRVGLPESELFISAPLHTGHAGGDPALIRGGSVEFGGRIHLFRREPPSTSIGARLQGAIPVDRRAGLVASVPRVSGALEARQQLGPVRLDLEAGGGGWVADAGGRVGWIEAHLGSLLQLGPFWTELGLGGQAWIGSRDGDVRVDGSIGLSLTRGVDIAFQWDAVAWARGQSEWWIVDAGVDPGRGVGLAVWIRG